MGSRSFMTKHFANQLKRFFRPEHIALFVWTLIIFPIVTLVYFYFIEILTGTASNYSFSFKTIFGYLGLQWGALLMAIPFLIPVFILFCGADHLLRRFSINVYWRYFLLWVTYILIRLIYDELLGSNRLWHYDRFWGAYMGLIQVISFTMVMLFVLSRVVKGKYDLTTKSTSDDQAFTN